MNRRGGLVVLVGGALFTSVALLWAATTYKSVQVRMGQVRQRPSFLSKVLLELPYGQQVGILNENAPWFQISTPDGREGWMHTSALSAKRIVLQLGGGASQSAASSDEVALAGKGFNEQVEDEFKARNPQANYDWVDRMEAISIAPDEMEQFLRQGEIAPRKGGS